MISRRGLFSALAGAAAAVPMAFLGRPVAARPEAVDVKKVVDGAFAASQRVAGPVRERRLIDKALERYLETPPSDEQRRQDAEFQRSHRWVNYDLVNSRGGWVGGGGGYEPIDAGRMS